MNRPLRTHIAILQHSHVSPRTRRATQRALIIAGLVILSSRTASAALLSNGDFEGGTFTQTFGTATDNLPNGWANLPPTNLSKVNVFANGSGPGFAQSGTHYLAFQSAVTDGTQDCLFEIINTVPNQQYTVSFSVAMTASPGAQFGLSPEWDAGTPNATTLGTNAFYFHPTNSQAVQYTFFSFTETASSTSTTFFLHGADATGAVLVDNVSIAPVPIPAAIWLLGSALGGLGFTRRRAP